MKNFFAKYLPVEGEIKEGDLMWVIGTTTLLRAGDDNFNKEFYTKVKLFLCSRDVQNETAINVHISFKVIGEISPEAIWVKEGDEFGEDEVTEPLFRDLGARKAYCYIQCPTCRNFH